MRDIKLLGLEALAQDYQTLASKLVGQAQEVQFRVRLQQWQRGLQSAYLAAGESTEGVEEAYSEVHPKPQLADTTIDTKTIQAAARDQCVEAWVSSNQVNTKWPWLAPQLLAYFGNWRAYRGEAGKYSPKLTWHHNVVAPRDLVALGAGLLAKASRGKLLHALPKGQQQYKSPINPLVPIILGGFKQFQGIDYELWDKAEIEWLVDREIAELAQVEVPPLTITEVLGLRNRALTPQTGSRAFKTNNPATTAALYHLGDTPIGHLPKLAKHMVLQTWAAHPQHRNTYAILDPQNWDRVPEPLVSTEIFASQPQVLPKNSEAQFNVADLPWNC